MQEAVGWGEGGLTKKRQESGGGGERLRVSKGEVG